MTKMFIDMDGTLCKTNEFFLHLVNYKHGTQYQVRDLQKWASWEDLDMTEEDFYEVYDYMNETGLMAHVPIMDPKIPQYIESLQTDYGYEIDIVTARDWLGAMHGKKWLDNHNIDCDLVSVERAQVVNKFDLGYDIGIDDCPQYYQKSLKEKELILHACPWNKPPNKVPENVIRLETWQDIYNYLTVKKPDLR